MTEEQLMLKREKDREYRAKKTKKVADMTEKEKKTVRAKGRMKSKRFREKKEIEKKVKAFMGKNHNG